MVTHQRLVVSLFLFGCNECTQSLLEPILGLQTPYPLRTINSMDNLDYLFCLDQQNQLKSTPTKLSCLLVTANFWCTFGKQIPWQRVL